MSSPTAVSDSAIHAGAGTSLVLAFLGLIPGFIPALALAGLITAILLLPVVVLGAAVVLITAPPYLTGRLIARARGGRQRQEDPRPVQAPSEAGSARPRVTPQPIPVPRAS